MKIFKEIIMYFTKKKQKKVKELIAVVEAQPETVLSRPMHSTWYNCPCGSTCAGECVGSTSKDCVCSGGCSGDVTFG